MKKLVMEKERAVAYGSALVRNHPTVIMKDLKKIKFSRLQNSKTVNEILKLGTR
jgi:hypothetical protein